jgi:RNA polymerase sigma factor (TIGR02999 family)
MSTPASNVTLLLRLVSSGDQQARAELFRLVEGELRKRAGGYLRQEQPDPAVQTTVLIDDAFLKLVGGQHVNWQDRAQFYRYAARAMQRILIDYARKRKAQKAIPGDRLAPLANSADPVAKGFLNNLDALELYEALERLAGVYPEEAEIFWLRYFGWQFKQIEDILHLGEKHVDNGYRLARGWLRRELATEDDDHEP